MEPAEEPERTRGRRLFSCSVLSTPKWYMPSEAPPERSSAVLPSACRDSAKNASFFSSGS
eukprot:413511-Rhodomonas_salina.1